MRPVSTYFGMTKLWPQPRNVRTGSDCVVGWQVARFEQEDGLHGDGTVPFKVSRRSRGSHCWLNQLSAALA